MRIRKLRGDEIFIRLISQFLSLRARGRGSKGKRKRNPRKEENIEWGSLQV